LTRRNQLCFDDLLSISHLRDDDFLTEKITFAESLSDIVTKWVPVLQDHLALDGCVKLLAVNKTDICGGEGEQTLLTEEAIAQAKQALGAECFRVSAKENHNVNELFEFAAAQARINWPVRAGTAQQQAHPRARAEAHAGHRCC
jgi:GTPase Era involved in 16S rRNA processing